MTAIATLTMNPALDVATSTPEVRHTHKLRCAAPKFDPGGGGINVARVVAALGGEATAIFPAGGPAGATLVALLAGSGVTLAPVPIAGATRESFSVTDESSGEQYRFVLPGPELSQDEQRAVLARLGALPARPDLLVVSGSFPPGVGAEFLRMLAEAIRALGVRLVLDSSGVGLREADRLDAYLIKPSLSELEALVGHPLDDDAAITRAARELIAEGLAEVVVVSLGADGALLVTDTLSDRFAALPVEAVSSVGAGDSMVGAIALGLTRGMGLHDAVRYGMAAGAAALLSPGTELAKRADVERLHAALIAQGA